MPGTSYEKIFDDVTTLSNASSAPGVVDQTFREHDVWKRIADESHRVSSTFTQDRYEFSVKAGRNKSLKYFQTTTAEVDLFDTQHTTKAWVPPAILGGVIVYNDVEKEQVEGSKDALNQFFEGEAGHGGGFRRRGAEGSRGQPLQIAAARAPAGV